jgi:hypothetical protein
MRLPVQIVVCTAILSFSCASVATKPSTTSAAIDLVGDWELRWDRSFAAWQPVVFEGKLHLDREGSTWKGQLSFRQAEELFALEEFKSEGDHLELRFQTNRGKDPLIIRAG